MLLVIEDVLDKERLAAVRSALGAGRFVDGRRSAGAHAQSVKSNEELDFADPAWEDLNKLVIGSLYAHPEFRSAVLPLRVSAAFFSRYREGMGYGPHTDDPVMGEKQRYRSDVAITVFLCEEHEYDGGELVIETSSGTRTVKLPAGHAVVYPASSLHRVVPVDRGERLAAVAWAQSLIRDADSRALLYELELARRTLQSSYPDDDATRKVHNVYNNLVRMWADV